MYQSTIRNQSWIQLLSIQAGGTICLPVIMAGQIVCQKFGWLAAMLAVGFGNAFLLVIGFMLASLSTYRPQSTVQQVVYYFGEKGRFIIASLMMLSMLGWFGIQLNVMSLSSKQLLSEWGISAPFILLNICLGSTLSGIMCFGMSAMKRLANFIAPVLGITLLYAAFSAKGSIPAAAPLTLSWLGGLSLVVGANIAAVIDLPTFLKYAKSGRDAKLCILLLYGLVVPFIEGVGIYLSAVTGGDSILEVLQIGHGSTWMIWISFFIILSGWSTNNANLYSSIASSYSFSEKGSRLIRTLSLGVIGVGIACFNPLGNIEAVLDLFGVTIGSMGAVMITSYLVERNSNCFAIIPWVSMLSGLAGVLIGLSTFYLSWFITGVPAFDAFLTAFIMQIFLNKKRRRVYETVNS